MILGLALALAAAAGHHQNFWDRQRAHIPRPVFAKLRRVRFCESRGVGYRANTGNGFYGGYQYTLSTARSAGFQYGRADLASPAKQDVRTYRYVYGPGRFSAHGWGGWPVCGRR